MNIEKINLDTTISKFIHRPRIKRKDGTYTAPLYARFEGQSEGSSELDRGDLLWESGVIGRYNSPTNVRRVFIGDKYAYIQYYKPQVNINSTESKLWTKASYNGLDLKEFGTGVLAGDNNGTRKILVKTGFGAIVNEWKMSNIEEIYITPYILLSEDIRNRYPETNNILNKLANNSTIKCETSILYKIFCDVESNSGDIEGVQKRFPRLKTIALVSNLDKVLESSGAMNIREGLPESISDIGIRWYSHIHKLGLLGGCALVCNKINIDISKSERTFVTRPGIYKFDAEVLEEYANKYRERIRDILRAERDTKIGNTVVEKGEFEIYLDKLLETDGKDIVSASLALTFARASKEEIDEAFRDMTEAGKSLYRGLLGR